MVVLQPAACVKQDDPLVGFEPGPIQEFLRSLPDGPAFRAGIYSLISRELLDSLEQLVVCHSDCCAAALSHRSQDQKVANGRRHSKARRYG